MKRKEGIKRQDKGMEPGPSELMVDTVEGRTQEEMQQELKLLIEYVQAFYKVKGKRVTQEDLALQMNRGSKYLSHLTNGHEKISEDHIIVFRNKYKGQLPKETILGQQDLKNITSELKVIKKAIAELQEKIPGGVDAIKYLKKLRKDIEIDLAE